MKQLFRTICLLACAGLMLDAQTPFSTKTTDVMVRVIPKPGVQREQIQKVIPEEVRATVRLYLEGKIRQWYSRSDGKGVILIVNATSISDAETVIDALPLSRANLVDHEYTELGPLAPLYNLIAPNPPR
jgi:hypothetical protein